MDVAELRAAVAEAFLLAEPASSHEQGLCIRLQALLAEESNLP